MDAEYYENYGLLANAIIIQAAKDYRNATDVREINSIKRFFLSKWFQELTNIDGKTLVHRLDEERKSKKENSRKKSD